MRAKNPLIERKRGDDGPGTEVIQANAPLDEAPTVVFMDEDATEVADQAPAPKRRKASPRSSEPARPTSDSSAPTEVRSTPPRSRMEVWGTDGAGALAAKVRVQRIEDSLPSARAPALKLLRARLDADTLATLDSVLLGELEEGDERKNPAQSPKRNLERLLNLTEFQQLETDDRASLLKPIAAEPRDVESIKVASRVLAARALERMSPRERVLAIELMHKLHFSQRPLLATLAERALHGRSALEDRDSGDALLIHHLHALADDRPLAAPIAAAGLRARDVLSMLLATLANPERMPLEEGGDGVLGAIEFALADASPAECARLWRCFVSGDLSAGLPSSGRLHLASLFKERPDTPIPGPEVPLRLGLELLVGLAHPRAGAGRGAFMMPGGHGIDADITARALGHLYGVGFTVCAGAGSALRHLAMASEDRRRVPPVFLSLLYEGGERLFPFDHLTETHVFFRAPHGTSSKPKGAMRLSPERTVEEPAQGLESVGREPFRDAVGVVLYPRT